MIVSVGGVSRPWLAKLPADLRADRHRRGRQAAEAHERAVARCSTQQMVKRWREAGGEFVQLSGDDQAR